MPQEDIERFVQDIPFLSFQQRRMLREQAQDLALWNLPGRDSSVFTLWPGEYDRTDKNAVRRIFASFMAHMDDLRHTPVDYGTFDPDYDFKGKMGANMYKCGNKTVNKHYLSWTQIDIDAPNFHRPDFFGTISFE